MKGVEFALVVWIMCRPLLIGCVTSEIFPDFGGISKESKVKYEYDRIGEVNKHCAFLLSSASELKPGGIRIRREMGFIDGDWRQDSGDSPMLPFDEGDTRKHTSARLTPLKLASFGVLDVDRAHRTKKSVSVSGFLSMGITLDGSFPDRPYEHSQQFQIYPGHTQLSISFQGIYMETKKNGGERLMCLLGTTMLPSRESDTGDTWDWVKSSQPALLQDDQILLVLRYPMTLTLTNRTIQGEMTSLNAKSNSKYFDPVHILSQSSTGRYEFGSGNLSSKACDPYPYQDNSTNGGIEIDKGIGFCNLIEQVTSDGGPITIVPNWRCNGTDAFCSRFGPFGSNNEINATDGSFKDVKLFMQNLICEQQILSENTSSAKVAAVFRAIPPSENQYTAVRRSGPTNMTLSAEGIWKSTEGQLCMVGCRGAESRFCDSRICLYIPLTFSIRQRSVIVGSITSIDDGKESYFPLAFEKLVQPGEMWNYYRNSLPYYVYSKIDLAGVVLERNEPFSFGTIIKKSFLQFPKLENSFDYMSSLSYLSEDLTLQTSAFLSGPSSNSYRSRIDVQMQIISLGPLLGRYLSWRNVSTSGEDAWFQTKAEYTEKQLLLNVSAQLTVSGVGHFTNFSMLFLEGLYDQHVGKMYLIGCRDVRASWNILFESMDLESGLDCLIETVVSYPPTTARWLSNPMATISISSQRPEDDPLYFKSIKLQTFSILYRKQREDILSRRGVEGILRILTLSFAIACISSQLFYIKQNEDYVPFVSIVMLGVQALGYSIPLITGAEALFKTNNSVSSYDLANDQWFHIIDYSVKLLVLVSFLLTLRLFQKVWKSRIRLLTRAPLELHRVPSDKRVLISTMVIHIIGFIIILIIHATKTVQDPSETESVFDTTTVAIDLPPKWGWETELEEYIGLVQDFFLLPQVIGNLIWQIDRKPLRKLYFVGITIIRLIPHIYDYISSPIPMSYYVGRDELVDPTQDFYSKFGDIAIPVFAFLLAVAVYTQQRWDYQKLSQSLSFGRYKLLPSLSQKYERLPSKSTFEAELASTGNGHEKKDDDEE
ncbi:hypothetical protein ACFE04_031945 [Oxalis oulophora]